MMWVRRWLWIQALMLHQGGFVFYSAVVVPIGTEQLGSALLQGLITQRVTWWLNVFGVAWLAAALWDGLATRPRSRMMGLFWLIRFLLLAAMVVLHDDMANFIDTDAERILDRRGFRQRHIMYLWLSTVDWLVAMVVCWFTLRRWFVSRTVIVADARNGTLGTN